MPLTTQFTEGVLEIRLTGELTTAELITLGQDVAEIEAREPVTPNRIVDLRGASTPDIKFAEVFSFAEKRRREKLRNPIRTAILATTNVHFGLARTFQSLNDNPQIAIRIFRDEAEARAWLVE